jgi:hypothetical protein
VADSRAPDQLAQISAWIDDFGTTVTSLLRQLKGLAEPAVEDVEDREAAEWVNDAKIK